MIRLDKIELSGKSNKMSGFFLMSGKQNYLQKSMKFPSEQLIECPKKDKMS